MIRKEKFQCTRDGLTIRGVRFADDAPGKKPVAVVSHEFMTNRLFAAPYARLLAEMGYAAYTYDFCGGCIVGSSSGKSRDMTVWTESRDLQAVLAFARSQEDTLEDHTVLVGCSQGGLVTALTAASENAGIDALVLLYPALSVPDDARKGHMIMARFDPEQVPETMWCGPMHLGGDYASTVMDLNVFEVIPDFPGPVLLIHGDADDLVPMTYSERARDAYQAAAPERTVRLSVIGGAGHIFLHRAHRDQAREEIRSFLTEVTGNAQG